MFTSIPKKSTDLFWALATDSKRKAPGVNTVDSAIAKIDAGIVPVQGRKRIQHEIHAGEPFFAAVQTGGADEKRGIDVESAFRIGSLQISPYGERSV